MRKTQTRRLKRRTRKTKKNLSKIRGGSHSKNEAASKKPSSMKQYKQHKPKKSASFSVNTDIHDGSRSRSRLSHNDFHPVKSLQASLSRVKF